MYLEIIVINYCIPLYCNAGNILKYCSTLLQIHPAQGKTLTKALEKAMKQRDLDVISCNVYTFNIINNNNTRLVVYTHEHM